MQQFVHSCLNVASIVLKGVDGALPVAAREFDHAGNVLRRRLQLPAGAASKAAAIELLSKNSL